MAVPGDGARVGAGVVVGRDGSVAVVEVGDTVGPPVRVDSPVGPGCVGVAVSRRTGRLVGARGGRVGRDDGATVSVGGSTVGRGRIISTGVSRVGVADGSSTVAVGVSVGVSVGDSVAVGVAVPVGVAVLVLVA